MKKIALAVTTILAGGVISNAALADAYVGGKFGYNTLNNACHLGSPCDDGSMAGGGHVGYNFHKHVGAEFGVDYLGNFIANFNKTGLNTVEGKLVAITLAPKFNLPLNDSWNVFAKAGAAYMAAGDERDFVPTGSLGAEYHINDNWDLRAEYQRYEGMSDDVIDDMNANFFGLGFNYKFDVASIPQIVEPRPVARLVDYPTQAATLYFGVDSAAPNNAAVIQKTVELMNTYPQAQLEITGHSDSTGSAAYNQKLTEKRAQSVADKFESKGIDADRMTVKGMGEANPVASNSTREGRQANRRVEVVVPAFQYKTMEDAK